jgi:hypothetical protein
MTAPFGVTTKSAAPFPIFTVVLFSLSVNASRVTFFPSIVTVLDMSAALPHVADFKTHLPLGHFFSFEQHFPDGTHALLAQSFSLGQHTPGLAQVLSGQRRPPVQAMPFRQFVLTTAAILLENFLHPRAMKRLAHWLGLGFPRQLVTQRCAHTSI